jgi:hypothetical protein
MEIRAAAETSWSEIFWWCVLIYAACRLIQEIGSIIAKQRERRLFEAAYRGRCRVKPPCGG